MDYGEKKAHRGRIDLSPGKCFAFPLKYNIHRGTESTYIYICVCFFPHAISFWNIIPGSLLPLFSNGQSMAAREGNHRRHTFTFLTKRYNVVLSFRTTRVRVPLARNPSPLQYPTLHVEYISVRSLLRQPRSALEAGPS